MFTGNVLALPIPYTRHLILFNDATDISECEDWNVCMILINEMEIMAKKVGAASNNELHCNIAGVTGDIHLTLQSL